MTADGKEILNQGSVPKLCLIKPSFDRNQNLLWLDAPGMHSISMTLSSSFDVKTSSADSTKENDKSVCLFQKNKQEYVKVSGDNLL